MKYFSARRNKSIEWLRENKIIYPKQFDIQNPFEILGIEKLTEIQELVMQKYKLFKYYGTMAFSASCGSGKTLAALYLIHKFGLKTLIISAKTSVNDQWEVNIKKVYPELQVWTNKLKNKNLPAPDIYICTPQFLSRDIDLFPIDVNFIIYDEVHSLIGEYFSKVLDFPFVQLRSGKRNNIPYMLALSGTYPKNDPKLTKIFGTIYKTKSSITDIPVNIYDFHVKLFSDFLLNLIDKPEELNLSSRIINKCKKLLSENNTIVKRNLVDGDSNNENNFNPEQLLEQITNLKSLGEINQKLLINFSDYYDLADEYKFIDEIIDLLKNNEVQFDSTEDLVKNNFKYQLENFVGFIITHTIDCAVYAAIRFADEFDCKTLFTRDNSSCSVLISRETILKRTSNGTDPFKIFSDLPDDARREINYNSAQHYTVHQYIEMVRNLIENIYHEEDKTNSFFRQIFTQNFINQNLLLTGPNKTGINTNPVNAIKFAEGLSVQRYVDENKISIVVGCDQKLKEGVSVENAVWGICTQFLYSTISRTQILGRIRRTSKNLNVVNHKRIFIVNSGKINNNEFQLRNVARKCHKKFNSSNVNLVYDFDYETLVFENENYKYNSWSGLFD